LKAKVDSRIAKRKMMALEQVLNDMAMKIFPYGERAARLQTKYLCNMGLTMNGMDVTAFARRLEQLSSYLPYFPMRLVNGKPVKPEPITEEKLVEALDSAIPERWEQMILRTGRAPEDFASIHEAVPYYVKFKQADDRSGHWKPRPTTQMGTIEKGNTPSRKKMGKEKRKPEQLGCGASTARSRHTTPKTAGRRTPANVLRRTKRSTGRGKKLSNVTFSKDQFQNLVKGFQAQKNIGGNEDAFIAKSGNDSDCKSKITSRAITAMYSHCQYCTLTHINAMPFRKAKC
jgi:hypothetical protein